jgi:hypothetical protein
MEESMPRLGVILGEEAPKGAVGLRVRSLKYTQIFNESSPRWKPGSRNFITIDNSGFRLSPL